MIAFEFDAADVVARLGAVVEKSAPATIEAIHRQAEAIMTRSKEEFVPVRDGILRSSGTVLPVERLPDGIVQATLQYGGASAPYAIQVHENPRSGKTGGVSPSGQSYATWAKVGQWKYLETPFLEAQSGLVDRLAADIGRQLGIR